jgi:hypothetical protein
MVYGCEAAPVKPAPRAVPLVGQGTEMAPQGIEMIDSGLANGAFNPPRSAEPQGFTHLPLAFDDLTAASMNARPLTPSSMVGKCADLIGFFPTRAALMASATSE